MTLFCKNPNYKLVLVSMISLILLLAVAPVSQAQGNTVVGGSIASDTTWTLTQSPYLVSRDLVVNQGVTLTIEPGVVVLFDPDTSLRIEGELVAIGTAEELISFSANSPSPQPGDWSHILFAGPSTDATYADSPGEDCPDFYLEGSIMRYTAVFYAGAGGNPAIQIENASPVISCSLVQFNAAQGVYAAGTSGYLYSNYISHNRGAGIFVDVNPGSQTGEAGIFIDSNYIYNNRLDRAAIEQNSGGAGLYLRDLAGYSFVSNNIIQDNTAEGPGGGIYAEGLCYSPEAGCSITIDSNSLINNQASAGAGIYAVGAVIQNNLVQRNDANAALALGDPDFGGGGGIHATDVLTITGNLVIDNRNQLSEGGGLLVSLPTDNAVTTMIGGNRIASNFSRGASTGGLLLVHNGGSSTGLVDSNSIVFNSDTGFSYFSLAVDENSPAPLYFGYNTMVDSDIVDEVFNAFQFNMIQLLCDNKPCPNSYDLYNNNLINRRSQTTLVNAITDFNAPVDATENWWGTTNTTIIDQYVYNPVEDGAQGETKFVDFLSAPEPLAPVIPPQNFNVTTSGDSFNLSWEANQESDIAGYNIYYDEDPGHPYEGAEAAEGPSLITVGNVTNYTLTGLAANKNYWFTVTAYDTDGFESWYAPEIKQATGEVAFKNGDFEQGYAGWNENYANLVVTGSALPDDLIPRSGDHVALLGMLSPAGSLTRHIADFSTELSQQITIDEQSSMLNYYYVLWSRGSGTGSTCSSGDISIWIDDETIASHDSCGDTRQQGWQLQEIDLSDYRGQTVTLRFRANVEDGAALVLDDLSLQPTSGGGQVFNRPPSLPGTGVPAPAVRPPVRETETTPIFIHDSGPLSVGGELEVDQSGVADFSLTGDGLYTRAPAGDRGWPDFDSVTLETCAGREYYDEMPHDPNADETFCFQTDRGFIGKFRILDRTASGELFLELLLWDHTTPFSSQSAAPSQPAATQPVSPQSPPFSIATGSPAYEAWGMPTNPDGCNSPYVDLQPVRRFKTELWLTNNTDQTISAGWGPTFISAKGRTIPTCVFDNNNRAVAPGETVQAKFGTFVENDDWVQGLSMSGFGQVIRVCLNPAGAEIACQ